MAHAQPLAVLAQAQAQAQPPNFAPPVSPMALASGLCVLLAVAPQALPPDLLALLSHPIGFGATLLAASATVASGAPPLGFALAFLALSLWAHARTADAVRSEAFQAWPAKGGVLWGAEAVLHERPRLVVQRAPSAAPLIQG